MVGTLKRTALALTAATLVAVGVAVPVAAPAALAAPEVCSDELLGLGGRYYCKMGFLIHTFPNGLRQVFVVGTDYAVYSRWETSTGRWNAAWYDMGGTVSSPIVVAHHDTYHPLLYANGTDGLRYFRHRATSGVWSEWARM